jgi:hypothetical protein
MSAQRLVVEDVCTDALSSEACDDALLERLAVELEQSGSVTMLMERSVAAPSSPGSAGL